MYAFPSVVLDSQLIACVPIVLTMRQLVKRFPDVIPSTKPDQKINFRIVNSGSVATETFTLRARINHYCWQQKYD